MKVRFWGVRGSVPVPGVSTARYGGNSSCLEVVSREGLPLVLDCGTGARELGRDLVLRKVPEVQILFTHFHMDHLFGFPFFGPIYSPNCRVSVVVPAYSSIEAQRKVGRYLNGVFHPVRMQDVSSAIRFDPIRPGGELSVGPYRIRGVALNHPGGSCGYRIEADGQVVVHLTDTAPLSRLDEGLSADRPPTGPEARVLDAVKGADVLVMDTMFSRDEFLEKMTWGHSYPEYGVRIAKAAGVRTLVLFHHAPDATDDDMDRLALEWAEHRDPLVIVAREGMEMDLSG